MSVQDTVGNGQEYKLPIDCHGNLRASDRHIARRVVQKAIDVWNGNDRPRTTVERKGPEMIEIAIKEPGFAHSMSIVEIAIKESAYELRDFSVYTSGHIFIDLRRNDE